jgi:hypothetical protein
VSPDNQHKSSSSNSAQITTHGIGHVFSIHKGSLAIKPGEQLDLSLGMFSAVKQPKGFSLEITPKGESREVIDAQFTFLGHGSKREFILRAHNRGEEEVAISVWSM